jgi:hypothetical protein
MKLDHVGVVAANIEKGVAAFERIGFKLTPRSFHSGSITPGGPVVPWGSANHCAMLRNGYLEMLAVVDPNLHSSARALIAKYEGTHIVAFNCDKADEAMRMLKERGATATGPINLQRGLEVLATGRSATAKFLNIYADSGLYPEARFLIIEHVTPELLWQPEYLDQPNGAIGLEEVFLCVDDPSAVLGKLKQLVGGEATPDSLRLSSGSLFVLSPAELKKRIPGAADIRTPFVAGFTVTVADIDKTGRLLRDSKIDVVAGKDALWVGAEDVCGAAVCFKQA